MENDVEKQLAFLEESKHSHFNVVGLIFGFQRITLLDLFVLMVLKRSISLVFGFTTLIRDRNFVSAAPLIRLQIDNLLRYHAAFMVDDQDRFVFELVSGIPIRQIKDRRGNRMTDAYLQNELGKEYPGLAGMYDKTSGYIHLSEEHFFNTIRASSKGEGRFEAYVGPDDKFVDPHVYLEAVETMVSVTHSLITDIVDWVQNKRAK
jgi:hypothetical protein